MSFIKNDVEIFSFIILLITYLNASKYQKKTAKYLKFLKATTIAVLVILFIDIVVLYLETHLTNELFVRLDYALLSINGVLTPLASCLWMMFLFYYLAPNDKNNGVKIALELIPLLFNASMAVYNLYDRFMYDVTLENGYTRGPGFVLFSLCSVFYILHGLIYVIQKRKQLNKWEFFILLSFEVFPMIGGLFQSLYYGIILTYPLCALSLTLIYVYLRQDISILDYVSKAYNNYYFNNFCNNYIIGKNKNDYSICYIDMDNLGKINEKFGQKEGDYTLAKFVEIVNECIEEPDFICSSNGDEFIIYFNNNDEETIIKKLKIICRNVEYFNMTSKKPYNINFTFVYHVNKDSKNSPFRILKTLYKDMADKKEVKLFENKYKPYIKVEK